ncbi:hypothetical protein ACF08M_23425 [Streptomyces sp. NPDC015032]|uniref:hypothetical protein n=1 Tax=Streptomyces sp. NPDC015032 TaxID=3364937 RepID=UPI0036FCE183
MVFFARHREHRTRAWPNTIAPGLGLVGLLAFFVLILENLTTLVGGSTALAIGIPALLAVALLLGLVMARRGAGTGSSPRPYAGRTAAPSGPAAVHAGQPPT